MRGKRDPKMSECQRAYDATNGCSPSPSVNHLLRASAIVATGVFLAITVVLLICILHRRRVIFFGRFGNGARRAHHPPALYVWSGPSTNGEPAAAAAAATAPPQSDPPRVGKFPKGGGSVDSEEPVSCVIMAGEARPTYLARPLPRDEFVDVSLDPKLDDLERGKRKATLTPSRGHS